MLKGPVYSMLFSLLPSIKVQTILWSVCDTVHKTKVIRKNISNSNFSQIEINDNLFNRIVFRILF